MLSLPLIPPRPDASLWPSHRVNNPYFETSSSDSQNQNSHNAHRRPGSQLGQHHHGHHGNHAHHSHHVNPNTSSHSYLAALTADENIIHQRKQNVRRFGAGWLRPPGVAKTYQAMIDEIAEREEQEILARREQVLADLQAAQTDAANREQAAEGQDEEIEGERDLDDDVPEAEAESSIISGSEVSSDVEEGDTSALEGRGDVTFNEDSFLEGSVADAAEVEHMLEMEEAEMAGVLQDERDLDDDVPEAGSYEHTDTELDYSSDVDNSLSRITTRSTGRRRSGRRSSGLPSVSGRRSSGLPSMSGRRSSGLPSVRSARGGPPPAQREGINLATNRIDFGLDGGRSSFGLDGSSSLLDGSSFLRSSPAAARGDLRSRFMGMGSRMPRGS